MQNSNEKIAGWIALVVTSLYTSISLPIQIFKITQTKDVGSLSLFMVVMLTLTFFSWVMYAVLKSERDWFIFIPNLVGFVCSIIILFQFVRYA